MPAKEAFLGNSCKGDLFLGVVSRKRDLSCGTPLKGLFKESGTKDTS